MYILNVKDYIDLHSKLNSEILSEAIPLLPGNDTFQSAADIVGERFGIKIKYESAYQSYIIFDSEEDAAAFLFRWA